MRASLHLLSSWLHSADWVVSHLQTDADVSTHTTKHLQEALAVTVGTLSVCGAGWLEVCDFIRSDAAGDRESAWEGSLDVYFLK